MKEAIEKSIERLRAMGGVPLAIVGYDVELDRFRMCILDGVDREEAEALLRKVFIELEP